MISNATPIICLSKINQLNLLKFVFGEIIIPVFIKEEILIKDKLGYDSIIKAIKEGWIKVVECDKKVDYGLGSGDNSVINLARERRDTAIIDDALAIKVARTLEIPIIRTTSVIFMALQRKVINNNEAIKILNQLIGEGYYIKPIEYAALLTKLKEL